jgi:hypothetical protein
MTGIKNLLRRSSFVTMALVLVGGWMLADLTLFVQHTAADQITSRSLRISSSANGSLTDGQNVTYTFTFTVPSAPATAVQSMDFQFCQTPLPGTDCNLPTGMDVTGAAIGSQTGLTGWSLGTAGNAPTNAWSNGTSGSGGRIRITRSNTTPPAVDTQATIAFTGIDNPTTDNEEFFVRMFTYTDTAWTTARDNGTVANSTAQQIDITAKVQETLNFSVGTNATSAGATCAALTGSDLALGDGDGVLSFQQSYDAHSYFRVSTNANNGTVIYYSGDTLKFGVNSIAAAGDTAVASQPGTEQFGLAIDNTGTQTSDQFSFTALSATAPYTGGQGTITAGGSAAFAFDVDSVTTPVEIASTSPAATITCDTGSVRYLGNIDTTTPPGVYETTISYLAVPTY